MTQELAQALTEAIGEEITLLAGQRATRLTAEATAAAVVDYALSTASSVDAGVTITLSAGVWAAGVVAGGEFYVGSGLHRGRHAEIDSVDSPTQITLVGAGLGFNFASQSYWVESAPTTTLDVETTLDWPAAGKALVDGTIYDYASKTLTTLVGITREARERAWGRVQFVSGALLVDGETLTVTDHENRTVVFEFDSNGTVTAGRVALAFEVADTAEEVRDTFLTLINSLDFGVKGYSYLTDAAELVQVLTGTAGNTTISDTVANAGFLVFGFIDGAITAEGIASTQEVLTPVVDWTGTYSVADRARRNVQVEYAEGEFLDTIGANLGVPRPYGLDDDDLYRGLIKLLAYGDKGTGPLITQVLDLVVGVGNWVKFTDGTGAYTTLSNGGTTLTRNTLRNNNIVYFWRAETDEQFVGKAILGQAVYALPASTTSIVLPENANTVESIKLAPDPLPVRLLRSGDMDGEITLGSPPLFTAPGLIATGIAPGDYLEILTGPGAGQRHTIQTPNLSDVDLGVVADMPAYPPPTVASEQFSWRIVRPISTFMTTFPGDETYIEYDGDPGTVIWAVVAAGGASEGANVSHVVDTPPNGGNYMLIEGNVGQSLSYRHTVRSVEASVGYFQALVRPDGVFGSGATDGDQWTMQWRDSARALAIGIIYTSGTEYELGFINASTGAFLGTPGWTGDLLTVPGWNVIRVSKPGDGFVYLYIDGVLVETAAYTDFATTADRYLTFGILTAPTGTTEFKIKTMDWQITTPTEFNSVRFIDASTTAPDAFEDDDAGGFFLASDATAPAKTLAVESCSDTNAAGGNALGVWEVDTYVDANNVTLVGLTQPNGKTFGVDDDTRFDVVGVSDAFKVPHMLGASLEILNGPNAGTYAIDEFIDPDTGTDVLTPYPTALALFLAAAGDPPFTLVTNALRVSSAFPDPSDDTVINWRIVPAFPADAAVTGVLHGASTLAADTITLRQALPYNAPVVQVTYTVVDSAQLLPQDAVNPLISPGVYTYYPFYLWDAWGYLRDIIADFLLVAGVEPDFSSLVVNDTGYHIL